MKPLAGRRIVVTQARAQARRLSTLLASDGADVVEIPAIRLEPPTDFGPFDRAIDRLGEYQWVVFTSQNAVEAFVDRLRARDGDPGSLARLRLASIGPATARALSAHGLRPALAPSTYVAEALVDAFARARRDQVQGARVLLPRALDARTVLPDGLRALGALVDVVPVYRVVVERDQDPVMWGRLLGEPVDAVTFTSPSTVRSLVALLSVDASRILGGTTIACIGPVTAQAVRECGLRPGLVADTYTIPGLVAALRRRVGRAAAVTIDRSGQR